MMFKKTALALTLLSLSLTASAEGKFGAGFGKLSKSFAEFDDQDISLNFIYASVAYNFEDLEKNYFIMPELRFASGVSEDSVKAYGRDVPIEIDGFIALSIRAQYEFSNGAYVYVMPSYSNLRGKISYNGRVDPENLWEFGKGAGLGYNLNKNIGVEASYEKYDEFDFVSVALKYNF